jgi:hypothetical protein
MDAPRVRARATTIALRASSGGSTLRTINASDVAGTDHTAMSRNRDRVITMSARLDLRRRRIPQTWSIVAVIVKA